jgi:hypothetical protein
MATHTQTSVKTKQVTIHIDKEPFRVAAGTISAEALRALPDPDIGPDRDLYLEVKGPGEDKLIAVGTSITVEKGMRFFTAPATITPGRAR